MTNLELLQDSLDEQLQFFEAAKNAENYLEMSNVADKISKLTYAIFFIQVHIPNN